VTTAARWIDDLADRHPTAEALVVPEAEGHDRVVTFAGLAERARRLAGGLRELGVGRGDRIASMLPNGSLPIELLLAAGRLGAVTIGVNTRFRSDDLRHVLERGRPKLLVAVEEFLGVDFADIVAEATAGVQAPPRVLWAAETVDLRTADPLDSDGASPEDPLVAFTTSGTTGKPKLAAHDHATTFRHLRAAAESLDAGDASTGALVLPFCGTFGLVSALSVLAGGGRVVVCRRFDPAATATLVEEHGVTHLNGSDDMLIAVLDQGRDLSTWRHGVVAEFTGRGLETVRRAEEVGARLTGVYGSSETFALLARWPEDAPAELRSRPGGMFVDPTHEVRVVDGEIQLKGPSVLLAYLVEEGIQPPPTVDGGWFPTGDLGSATDGSSFVYQARMGDALRLRGFLTDPAEIEQHLMSHAGVDGAQVVGAPGGDGGEVAVAFVVTAHPIAEEVLADHCRRHLANYKVPARIIAVDDFPTVDGPNGVKIRKADLRARATQVISRGGTIGPGG
jgi:fatty-acyl-CoA synthase